MESTNAFYPKDIVPPADHRQNRRPHMFGLVYGAERKLEQAEQSGRTDLAQDHGIAEKSNRRRR